VLSHRYSVRAVPVTLAHSFALWVPLAVGREITSGPNTVPWRHNADLQRFFQEVAELWDTCLSTCKADFSLISRTSSRRPVVRHGLRQLCHLAVAQGLVKSTSLRKRLTGPEKAALLPARQLSQGLATS
jgi:hypothetical protein